MGRLSNNKKIKLLRIEKERKIISMYLENGFVTETDIINIINKEINYGLINSKKGINQKQLILKNIFNCPFLLCDQDSLSLNMKKLLPHFLNARYTTEKETLESYYNEGYISKEELNKELEELEFVYYRSSLDGINIMKMGHVINVKDNIIRTK